MDIDFEFVDFPGLNQIVSALRSRGAGFVEDNSIVVTTDGDFTWERREVEDLADSFKEMESTLLRGECVGFRISWPVGKGGRILLIPESGTLSFSPNIDTLKYGVDPSSVGLGWYLDELGEMLRSLTPMEMTASNRA